MSWYHIICRAFKNKQLWFRMAGWLTPDQLVHRCVYVCVTHTMNEREWKLQPARCERVFVHIYITTAWHCWRMLLHTAGDIFLEWKWEKAVRDIYMTALYIIYRMVGWLVARDIHLVCFANVLSKVSITAHHLVFTSRAALVNEGRSAMVSVKFLI